MIYSTVLRRLILTFEQIFFGPNTIHITKYKLRSDWAKPGVIGRDPPLVPEETKCLIKVLKDYYLTPAYGM